MTTSAINDEVVNDTINRLRPMWTRWRLIDIDVVKFGYLASLWPYECIEFADVVRKIYSNFTW